MNTRRTTLVIVLLVVAGAISLGWFKFVARPAPVVCAYCNRPLHDNLKVTAEIAGTTKEACCARCAISEANQQHKHLRLITVHDYTSGRALSPANAWFVEGSRAMACQHDEMRMNEMKGTEELAFDRCSPGTFSFADKHEADSFTRQNGGAVLSLSQLMNEARYQ